MSITDKQRERYAELAYLSTAAGPEWPAWSELKDNAVPDDIAGDAWWSPDAKSYWITVADTVADAARADLIDAIREEWESEYFLSTDPEGK